MANKVTITVNNKSHSITLPAGADIDAMINAAALQAGWTPTVDEENEKGETTQVENPVTALRFLFGHTLKGWKNLVNAYKIGQAQETSRAEILADSATLEAASVIE